MVIHHCDRCAHDTPVHDFQVGSVVQCDTCGYVSNVASPAGEAPPKKAIHRRPPPVPPPVQQRARPTAKPRRGPSRFLIGLVVACVACTLAALVFGNPATRLIVPFVALAALNGYRVGGLKVVAGVLGLVIGAVLAFPVGRLCEGPVGRVLGLGGLGNRLLSIVVAGVLLAILAAFLLDCFVGQRLRRRPRLALYDKWVGSGLGMAQGVLIVAVLLWGILCLEPVANARLAMAGTGPGARQADPTASRIVGLAGVIRASTMGQIAEAANPLAEARIVTLPGKCLAMLNDPAALDSFNRHPAVKRVAERPVVKEVLRVLAEDPQISEILRSDEDLSQHDLAVILSSPKLLEVLDQTDLTAELAPIADDIEQAVNRALDDAVARSAGR